MEDQARFKILHEVYKEITTGERLCLQWGYYEREGCENERGFRLIWRNKERRLQTRVPIFPSKNIIRELFDMATEEGWGKNTENVVFIDVDDGGKK